MAAKCSIQGHDNSWPIADVKPKNYQHMKYLFSLVLVAFAFKSIAQDNNQKSVYIQKMEKFQRMKTGGTVMIAAGAVLAIVGISNISSAEYHYDPYTGQRVTNDPKAVSGAFMFLGGFTLLGGGIPLAIVGSKQKNKYERKIQALTLNLNVGPQRQGLTLAYKF